uniref:Uncharacterized protein n=1 Tax=Physcomitrium patens TaxID=3218 RepID=A0A2K1KKH9_PHYPA|nr:hypothetical protein PHYPA_007965 [Physcomitrium patens]
MHHLTRFHSRHHQKLQPTYIILNQTYHDLSCNCFHFNAPEVFNFSIEVGIQVMILIRQGQEYFSLVAFFILKIAYID